MNDHLLTLVTNAKSSPDGFWPLVDGLRLAAGGDPLVLLAFARSAHKVERKAAAAACGGQTDRTLLDALVKLATDPELEVRQELGYNLKNWRTWHEMDAAVARLMTDHDINIRQNAVWAAQHRPALLPKVLERLTAEQDLWVRAEVGHVLGGCPASETYNGTNAVAVRWGL
jgi:HEAT repeat protein